MKDWENYTKITTEARTSTGEPAKVGGYILVKITDNFIVIGLVILMLIFACIGIFYETNQPEKTNWALYASELFLGLFLGLITSKYNRNKK